MHTPFANLRSRAARLLQKLLSPVADFEWSVVYRIALDRPPEIYRADTATEISQADERDIAEIVGVTRFHTAEVLRERFDAGNICLVARKDGELAAFNWVVFADTRDAYFVVQPGEDEAYCMDARTYEDFRGQGLHTELLSRLLIHARERGCRQAYTRVSAANASSWKTHVRLGWQETGSIWMIRPKLVWRRRMGGPARHPLRIDTSDGK